MLTIKSGDGDDLISGDCSGTFTWFQFAIRPFCVELVRRPALPVLYRALRWLDTSRMVEQPCISNTPTVFPKRQLSFYAALLCIVGPVWAVTPLSIFTVGWLAATRPILSMSYWELALFTYCTIEVSVMIC